MPCQLLTNSKQTERIADNDANYLDLTVFTLHQAVIKVKPRQPAWQHRYLWSKHVFAKHPRCNIKDISGSGSEAMQMRSHPFGNVHHMQLEISPGYTELFVPLKTEEFHSDVHPMAQTPSLPHPKKASREYSSYLIWQVNVTKTAKHWRKNPIETSLMISKCEVFNLLSHPEAG